MDPRDGLDDVKRKFLTIPGLELRPHGRPARSQPLYRLRTKIMILTIRRPMNVIQHLSTQKWHRRQNNKYQTISQAVGCSKSAGPPKRNESHLFYMQERWLVASLVITAVKCKSVVFTVWLCTRREWMLSILLSKVDAALWSVVPVPLKLFNGAVATERFMWLPIKWWPCRVNWKLDVLLKLREYKKALSSWYKSGEPHGAQSRETVKHGHESRRTRHLGLRWWGPAVTYSWDTRQALTCSAVAMY
jgi:hypothetical protein